MKTKLIVMLIVALLLSACSTTNTPPAAPTVAQADETWQPPESTPVAIPNPTPEELKGSAKFPSLKDGEVEVWTLKGDQAVTPSYLREQVAAGGLVLTTSLEGVSVSEVLAVVALAGVCYFAIEAAIYMAMHPMAFSMPQAVAAPMPNLSVTLPDVARSATYSGAVITWGEYTFNCNSFGRPGLTIQVAGGDCPKSISSLIAMLQRLQAAAQNLGGQFAEIVDEIAVWITRLTP